MDKEKGQFSLIIEHFILLTCLMAAGYENKTANVEYYPTRFTIKSQGHGTILKGMYMILSSTGDRYFQFFTICHDHQDRNHLSLCSYVRWSYQI